MIVIDRNEDQEDETLPEFIPSHLDSEINSFRGSLDNLMQCILALTHACDGFIFLLDDESS